MSESYSEICPITTKDGKPLTDIDLEFESEIELLDELLTWKIDLIPLDEVDREVDPEVFVPELTSYLRSIFGSGKQAKPVLEYKTGGNLFRTTFWIFETVVQGEAFFVMVVRDMPITEFAIVEKEQIVVEGSAEKKIELTPEQAAAFDLFNPEAE